MSLQHIPEQPPQPSPESAPAVTAAGVAVPPGAATSEATRLLCAGAYLDHDFRDTVVDELYVHEERIVAPSLGVDASRVLAHALRARRLEAAWAAAVVALWVLAFFLAGPFFYTFLLPCALLTLADRVRGGSAPGPLRAEQPGGAAGAAGGRGAQAIRRGGAVYLRLTGRLVMVFHVLAACATAFGGDELRYDMADSGLDIVSGEAAEGWYGLLVPVVMAVCVAAHRELVARAVSGELSPRAFTDPARADPAEATAGRRFARLRESIRSEQWSPLIYYRTQHPFLGAGTPYDPWTLAVELRENPEKRQTPLSNREILDRIKPLVKALRVPADPGSPRAGAVRDRLRGLEVDECVFVRATGVPVRSRAPLGPRPFEGERERAVEEGGEGRRHFLRIRVGAWEEELVVTVFVRVHTQGGMLVLEIAPHVLRPIRPDFRAVDHVADAYHRGNVFGRALGAFGQLPTSALRSVLHVVRAVGFQWRISTGGHADALPDGPWTAVRELGGDQEASLFQEMDAARYLKSVQDRVANGVREALDAAGWRTGEFVQQVVNVSGVYIGSAENSAIAVGDSNRLDNKSGTGPDDKHRDKQRDERADEPAATGGGHGTSG